MGMSGTSTVSAANEDLIVTVEAHNLDNLPSNVSELFNRIRGALNSMGKGKKDGLKDKCIGIFVMKLKFRDKQKDNIPIFFSCSGLNSENKLGKDLCRRLLPLNSDENQTFNPVTFVPMEPKRRHYAGYTRRGANYYDDNVVHPDKRQRFASAVVERTKTEDKVIRRVAREKGLFAKNLEENRKKELISQVLETCVKNQEETFHKSFYEAFYGEGADADAYRKHQVMDGIVRVMLAEEEANRKYEDIKLMLLNPPIKYAFVPDIVQLLGLDTSFSPTESEKRKREHLKRQLEGNQQRFKEELKPVYDVLKNLFCNFPDDERGQYIQVGDYILEYYTDAPPDVFAFANWYCRCAEDNTVNGALDYIENTLDCEGLKSVKIDWYPAHQLPDKLEHKELCDVCDVVFLVRTKTLVEEALKRKMASNNSYSR